MNSFAPRITRIVGLSDRRRLPRLGKVRLGFKLKKDNKEYPAELPFFFLPQEVARVYGGKVSVERAMELGTTRKDVLAFISANAGRMAEEIEIMLPVDDIETVFPNAYKWYGSSRGTKCMGDGQTAYRYNDESKNWDTIPCPCEMLKTERNPKGECTQRAHLMALIPKVNMGGIYQIDCGSYHSIVDLNSGIDYVRALVGRVAMVPLVLRRIPTQTHHDGKKQVHFTMQILMNVPIEQLEGLRRDTGRILQHSSSLLIEHEDINPAMDTEAEIVVETKDNPEEEPGAPEGKTETQETAKCSGGTQQELTGTGTAPGKAPGDEDMDRLTNEREALINSIKDLKCTFTKQKKIAAFKKIREQFPPSVDSLSIGDLRDLEKKLSMEIAI
jgi:hypothetical protein